MFSTNKLIKKKSILRFLCHNENFMVTPKTESSMSKLQAISYPYYFVNRIIKILPINNITVMPLDS